MPLSGLAIRKSPKGRGANKLIEGLGPCESLDGKKVAILEDTTTTGVSALKAVHPLRAEGAMITEVVSILDRNQGARELLHQHNLEFDSLLTVSDLEMTPC